MSHSCWHRGLHVVAGFDHNSRAIQGYDYNHIYRGGKGHVVDLAKASGKQLLDLAGLESVDFVAGGPPCQAFSIAGKRKGLKDGRGMLVFEFVRLVSELQPKVVMFENVPNLMRISDGRIFSRIMRQLRKQGYGLAHGVLLAADYGVPQMRKRLFLLGVKGFSHVEFPPPPTHTASGQDDLFQAGLLPHVSCKDVLEDLPDVATEEGDKVPNHEPTMHSPAMLEAFANLAPGKRDRKSFHDRLHPDKPGYTLRAGEGNFSPLRPVHYEHDRVISVRESARLQGLSDVFIWPDVLPRLQQYRQVGNAVPPPVAEALAHLAIGLVGWEPDPDGLRGDPNSRPPHALKTAAQRQAERAKRIRGASLGRGRKQAPTASRS